MSILAFSYVKLKEANSGQKQTREGEKRVEPFSLEHTKNCFKCTQETGN